MSNSLSVRDQNSFVSAYKNLLNENDSRIHKKDVNKLEKILSKCDKVEVGQLLMTKMERAPKDPTSLENTFSKLFDKLANQESGMHKNKEDKLKSIQQKLTPVVQDIHSAEIKGQIKALGSKIEAVSRNISSEKNDIAKQQEAISSADAKIKRLNDEIKPLAAKLKGTSEAQFAAKDDLRQKETEAKISRLEEKQNAEVSALKNEITKQQNSRTTLLDFAKRHHVHSAGEDLKRAESGALYDSRDMGFGTTSWREHMGSDKYAIKNFGHIEKQGRRQYSAVTKEPNQEGKQWQKLMKNFNEAPKNIRDLNRQLTQLKSEHQSQIREVTSENKLSSKQVIEKKIHTKYDSIATLENNKSAAQQKIDAGHKSMSLQEAKKDSLAAQMELLKSQI